MKKIFSFPTTQKIQWPKVVESSYIKFSFLLFPIKSTYLHVLHKHKYKIISLGLVIDFC